MGQRELAYEINKMKTGYYFLYVVEADSDTVKDVLLPVYLNSGSLVSRPIKNTLFIIFPHFLVFYFND